MSLDWLEDRQRKSESLINVDAAIRLVLRQRAMYHARKSAKSICEAERVQMYAGRRFEQLRFAEYAAAMFAEFGADVPIWATLNEPAIVSYIGHWVSKHPARAASGHFSPGNGQKHYGRVV